MDTTETEAARPSSVEESFVERLAAFLKATFVYPDNNIRVEEAADACTRVLEELRASCGGANVQVAVESDRVVCAGAGIEPPLLPTVAWLKATMEATALAGLEFDGATRDSLFAFAARLRENFVSSRRRPSFDALWAEPIAGLRLIEPRFAGSASDAADPRGSASHDSAMLSKSLRRHPGIAGRVQDLEDVLTEQSVTSGAAASGELRQADIVEQVIQMLPPEIRGNQVALIKTVESILALTTDQIRGGGESRENDEGDLRTMLLHMCRTFFMRADGQGETADAARKNQDMPRGHPGDDLVTDDLAALLEEVEQLPRGGDEVDLSVSEAERFGVCLHQLLTTPKTEHVDSIQPHLVAQLDHPGTDELELIRQYVAKIEEQARGGAAASDLELDRLLTLLRDPRHTYILQSTLTLPDEFVFGKFPAHFGMFLDTLDLADSKAMARVPHLARRLGRARILYRTGPLLKDGLLDPERVAKLLAEPDQAMLPFVEILLEHGDRTLLPQIVSFLRKLDPQTPASAALCVDEEELTAPFLLSLCKVAQGDQNQAAATIRTAVNLLKRFTASHSEDPALIQRQVYAVHALRRVWSGDVHEHLKKLGKRFRLAGEVPKAIREAAREACRLEGTKGS